MIASPLLTTLEGIAHGFGTRLDPDPPFPGVMTVKQVHGTYVYFIDDDRQIEKPGYDVLMTTKEGTSIGVKTADCLPILAVEPNNRIIIAAHAGWRGTHEGIIQRTVEEIDRRRGRVEDLAVALGPCIQGNCYEVEAGVASLFEQKSPASTSYLKRISEAKWLLDLQGIATAQLVAGGVRPERIDRIPLCTHCRPDLFHSYRRDGNQVGRQVSFIKLFAT